ncbi:MAG: hypothetical protein US18_C0028G0002 [Parcubacteria group bacterium GW2011_GWB1_36_5]|nr:MAG: hypothetical protein US18_C0028G0002 [Parcubacteria group bacterium GW2011_GWB1_36_5]
MSKYIINKNAQSTGENEVHEEARCDHLPLLENRIFIGFFDTCRAAIATAKAKWPRNIIDGCAYCCPACHTR